MLPRPALAVRPVYPRAVRAADRCGAGIPASPELRTDEVRLAPIEASRLEVRQPEVLRREVSAALQVVRLQAVEEAKQLVPMEQARQMAQPQEAARSAQQGAGSMLEELQEPAPLKKPVALSFAVQPLAAVLMEALQPEVAAAAAKAQLREVVVEAEVLPLAQPPVAQQEAVLLSEQPEAAAEAEAEVLPSAVRAAEVARGAAVVAQQRAAAVEAAELPSGEVAVAAVQEAVEVLLQEAVVVPAARPSARPEAVPSVAASACRPGLAQQVVRLARAQRVRCEIAQSSTSRKKPKGQWWQEGPSEALSCQPAVRRESFNSVQRSERFGESISMYRWGRNVADVNAATRFILE